MISQFKQYKMHLYKFDIFSKNIILYVEKYKYV